MADRAAISNKSLDKRDSSLKKKKPHKGGKIPLVKHSKYALFFGAISACLPPHPSGEASDLSFRLKLLPPSSKTLFDNQKNSLIRQILGTQEPKVRLHYSPVQVQVTSGIIAFSVPLKFNQVIDYTNWSALFDEMRPIEGLCTYHSNYNFPTVGGFPIAAGCIDYVDGTVADFTSLVPFDTVKIFPLVQANPVLVEWPYHFQGPPDEGWIQATAYTIVWGYWKVANQATGGLTISGTVGLWGGSLVVQFRQIA